MTMQHQNHPDDERLSALAGGDPEATGDTALRAHLESCDRCTSLVRELGELRVALAQLPDVAPSRPLQLVPPVAEHPARGGWLRRLAAPAMAAGAAMLVVGAVGFGAISLSGLGASGAAPEYQDAGANAPEGPATDAPVEDAASPTPAGGESLARGSVRPMSGSSEGGYRFRVSSPMASDGEPAAEGGDDEAPSRDVVAPAVDFNQPTPWLVLLVSGAALLVTGLILRSAVTPRAG